MPISEYFHGAGNDVMASMVKRYGEKKGKQVFYATANKNKQKPKTGGKLRAKVGHLFGRRKNMNSLKPGTEMSPGITMIRPPKFED